MKPHRDVAEGPTWHSPRSGLVQPDAGDEPPPCDSARCRAGMRMRRSRSRLRFRRRSLSFAFANMRKTIFIVVWAVVALNIAAFLTGGVIYVVALLQGPLRAKVTLPCGVHDQRSAGFGFDCFGCFWLASRHPFAAQRPQMSRHTSVTIDTSVNPEWRLDKAQQNGAFLRKWPQMLVGGSRKPGSIPCKPRFPRAGWVSTEAKKDQGGLRPPRGHPEATLRPPDGQPVGTLKLPGGYPKLP